MFTTYSTVTGDTFDSIARKKYGTETQAAQIAKANPGILEPLAPGTVLYVPLSTTAPKDKLSTAAADDADEISLFIDGQVFKFWDGIRVARSIDSMSEVNFGAPFEPSLTAFRQTFKPFSYKSLFATIGGEPFFTGTMVDVVPVLENKKRIVSVSGYGTPGVLGDCTPPASAFPIEFNNQRLPEIASTLLEPFGIPVIFEADAGSTFERVALEPSQLILDFLIDLATQRGLIISDDQLGGLVFTKSTQDIAPVAVLTEGQSPLLSVTPSFSSQDYFSSVTGIEPVSVGFSGSKYTVKNERLAGALRPFTFKASDTLNADLKAATEAKMGRMFANAAAYTIRVSTWRTPNGNLWSPNTIISLNAPSAMIYGSYDFLIRSVELEAESNKRTAVLNLVIPSAFRGEIPRRLPWEE